MFLHDMDQTKTSGSSVNKVANPFHRRAAFMSEAAAACALSSTHRGGRDEEEEEFCLFFCFVIDVFALHEWRRKNIRYQTQLLKSRKLPWTYWLVYKHNPISIRFIHFIQKILPTSVWNKNNWFMQ